MARGRRISRSVQEDEVEDFEEHELATSEISDEDEQPADDARAFQRIPAVHPTSYPACPSNPARASLNELRRLFTSRNIDLGRLTKQEYLNILDHYRIGPEKHSWAYFLAKVMMDAENKAGKVLPRVDYTSAIIAIGRNEYPAASGNVAPDGIDGMSVPIVRPQIPVLKLERAFPSLKKASEVIARWPEILSIRQEMVRENRTKKHKSKWHKCLVLCPIFATIVPN